MVSIQERVMVARVGYIKRSVILNGEIFMKVSFNRTVSQEPQYYDKKYTA